MYVIATVLCSNFHFSVSLHVPSSQFLFERDSYSNSYLLAKFGFDTTENEHSKVCRTPMPPRKDASSKTWRPTRNGPPPLEVYVRYLDGAPVQPRPPSSMPLEPPEVLRCLLSEN